MFMLTHFKKQVIEFTIKYIPTVPFKGIWYMEDEQIWLILGFDMLVSKVYKIFFSKFDKW